MRGGAAVGGFHAVGCGRGSALAAQRGRHEDLQDDLTENDRQAERREVPSDNAHRLVKLYSAARI
jgi:hypothetical protein